MPSPFPATSFLGSTTTSLLNSFLSSGVMTFCRPPGLFGSGCLPLSACCCWVPPLLPEGVEGRLSLLLLLLAAGGGDGRRGKSDGAAVFKLKRGAGKLFFLSIASMSRWNFLKSASARMSVDSRSMLPESSLTAELRSVDRPFNLGPAKFRDCHIPYFSTSSKC